MGGVSEGELSQHNGMAQNALCVGQVVLSVWLGCWAAGQQLPGHRSLLASKQLLSCGPRGWLGTEHGYVGMCGGVVVWCYALVRADMAVSYDLSVAGQL
jgi:hypothetical protein